MNYGNRTTLFSNGDGFVALNTPVKIKVLELLESGPKSFDEIVRCTNKAKSTISVHLNDLRQYNLIKETSDDNDKRKKNYHLNCQLIASS
ncbi:helix-turn-helix transcriptional regulator [Methanohalobium sp.]|uniref:ArsR/SmtB family transcription factor n=1 Tax=Methanohalobium sp. TaxID=2837493 RepID=UPI0025FA84E0|nr:winged helix-turn-helix domain-containing protein [Methanohalobium sp.]